MIDEIKPADNQRLFFSSLDYMPLYALGTPQNRLVLNKAHSVLLLTGIAMNKPLVDQTRDQCGSLDVMEFSDHHYYTDTDIDRIKWRFDDIEGADRIMITTEKDATRLIPHLNKLNEYQIPVYCQPVQMKFLGEDAQRFNQIILNYVDRYR